MATTTTTCNCGCHPRSGRSTIGERPRYYARQLVTPDDMTLEQEYFRTRLRLHNRFLHGWGVVCGARVALSNKPWCVIVKSGYILGPYGDEIYIRTDMCVDVRIPCTPAETPTNGCEEAVPATPSGAVQYLAVQYVEEPTTLVRVPLGGCGCNDNSCEYTRYRDSYQICVLDHCPNVGDPGVLSNQGTGSLPDCPPCPSEPWVPLGSFTVDAKGAVTLQECDCRRQALGFGSFWWTCNSQQMSPTPAPTPDPTGKNTTPTKPSGNNNTPIT